MLTILYALLLLLALIYVLSARRTDILAHPFMYLLGTVVFLFPGAILNEAALWHVDQETAWRAFWLMALSLAGVLVGYLPVPRGEKTALDGESGRQVSLSPRLLHLALLLCIAVKVFLDPDTLIGRLLTEVERPEGALGKYFVAFASLPTAMACLGPWMWRNVRPQSRSARATVITIVCVGLFSISRTPMFYVLGVLLFTALYRRSEHWRSPGWRLVAVGCAAGAVPVMIFVAAVVKGSNLLVDNALAGWGLDVSEAFGYAWEQQYTLAVSDAYGNLLFILESYPGHYAFVPGLSAIILATAFIPREWIPWKPMSVSYRVTAQILGDGIFEKTGTSLATSFVGELWINGGTVAVLIGSLLLGRLGRVFRRVGTRGGESDVRQTIYLMSLVMYVLVPRGDILSIVVRGLIYIILAYLSARILIAMSARSRMI